MKVKSTEVPTDWAGRLNVWKYVRTGQGRTPERTEVRTKLTFVFSDTEATFRFRSNVQVIAGLDRSLGGLGDL